MRVRVGDVIEPAELRRNVAYREFFDSIKYRVRGINDHTTIYEIRYTVDSLLTDTPNNGCLPNNGHCYMHQLQSPYI